MEPPLCNLPAGSCAGATIKAANNTASLTITLTTPKEITRMFYRGHWGTGAQSGTAQVSTAVATL